MASTYSPLLRLELIAAGEQAGLWGNTTNGNLGSLMEQAIAGVTTVALTGLSPATYTLSSLNGALDEARAAALVVQGTPAGATTIVVPALQKNYLIKNATAQTLTFKTAAQVGGVDVVTSGATVIFCDGSSVFSAISKINVSELLGVLPVANGGTGSATATGTGLAVLAASPALTGTPTVPTRTFGDNTTAAASTAFVQAAVATGAGSAVPVGTILMWPSAAQPTGYAHCNGQALSRVANATLFGVIGTTFGAGDGVSTFNVPNYVDRMAVGCGNLYATSGMTGGSKDAIVVSHTHTINASGSSGGESALHSHNVADPGHAHTYSLAISTGNQKPNSGGTAPFDGYQGATTDAAGTGISLSTQTVGHTHSITVSGATTATGVSGTNSNLPPYISMFFIIKAS